MRAPDRQTLQCFVPILGGTPVEGNDFSPLPGVPKINSRVELLIEA